MNEDNKLRQTLEEEESQALVEDLEFDEQQGKKTKKRLREKILIRNIVIFIMLIVIVILLLKGCGSDIMMAIYTKPEIETTDYLEQKDDGEQSRKDHIAIYTLMDGCVSKDYPNITLRAPKENFRKFYVKFEIYVDGNDVLSYATDLIDVKEDEDFKVSVNMYDLLNEEVGDHEVAVRVKAYDYDNLQPASSTIQKITISVN